MTDVDEQKYKRLLEEFKEFIEDRYAEEFAYKTEPVKRAVRLRTVVTYDDGTCIVSEEEL